MQALLDTINAELPVIKRQMSVVLAAKGRAPVADARTQTVESGAGGAGAAGAGAAAAAAAAERAELLARQEELVSEHAALCCLWL